MKSSCLLFFSDILQDTKSRRIVEMDTFILLLLPPPPLLPLPLLPPPLPPPPLPPPPLLLPLLGCPQEVPKVHPGPFRWPPHRRECRARQVSCPVAHRTTWEGGLLRNNFGISSRHSSSTGKEVHFDLSKLGALDLN